MINNQVPQKPNQICCCDPGVAMVIYGVLEIILGVVYCSSGFALIAIASMYESVADASDYVEADDEAFAYFYTVGYIYIFVGALIIVGGSLLCGGGCCCSNAKCSKYSIYFHGGIIFANLIEIIVSVASGAPFNAACFGGFVLPCLAIWAAREQCKWLESQEHVVAQHVVEQQMVPVTSNQ